VPAGRGQPALFSLKLYRPVERSPAGLLRRDANEAEMTRLRYMSLHTLGAAVFIFVLNFLILGTSLQTALIWAIGFGTFAFVLARQHTQR
jgi:hypothetical protein